MYLWFGGNMVGQQTVWGFKRLNGRLPIWHFYLQDAGACPKSLKVILFEALQKIVCHRPKRIQHVWVCVLVQTWVGARVIGCRSRRFFLPRSSVASIELCMTLRSNPLDRNTWQLGEL